MNISRKYFMAAACATAIVPRLFGKSRPAAKLPITIAGYDVDRVRALMTGKVAVEGCDVRFEVAAVGDMNTHVFSGPGTREVSEIGLHPFMLAYANEGFRDYTLIPVFPLRLFRHKSIFIRTGSGIETPADLRGRRVATPYYSSTSLTWLRGIVEHEYGVRPAEIQWVIARKDSSGDVSGQTSAQEQMIPEGIPVSYGSPGMDESELLVNGEVDALFHAAEPKAYLKGDPRIQRLFGDYRSVEQTYFKKTGIFPIMHAVAMRKATIREYPWLPKAVFDAYAESKRIQFAYMQRLGWAYESLPWFGQEFAETKAAMGNDYWPYGIAPNRKALETLFQYSHEQGLASRKLTVEELFHSPSLEFTE
jgi:4,5-dihydroxyphthalate decarboxylase